jgi:hypothetical protein
MVEERGFRNAQRALGTVAQLFIEHAREVAKLWTVRHVQFWPGTVLAIVACDFRNWGLSGTRPGGGRIGAPTLTVWKRRRPLRA